MTTGATPAVGVPEQGPFINLDAVALPAAGALTSQGYTALPGRARRLSAVVTYAKGAGAASGKARMQLQWQMLGGQAPLSDVAETIIDAGTLNVSGSIGQSPEYALEILGPATSSTISFRMLSAEVPMLATGARVLAAEAGDTANPGTITVRFYTSDQV